MILHKNIFSNGTALKCGLEKEGEEKKNVKHVLILEKMTDGVNL
jgi:hypothetical protein